MLALCALRRRGYISYNDIVLFVCFVLATLCIHSSRCESSSVENAANITVTKEPETVSRLVTFKHQTCNDSIEYLMDIHTLSLASNMTSRTSQVLFNFIGDLISDVDAPIELDIHISMRVGFLWIPMPCVRQVGSCHFEDVCGMTSQYSCPDKALREGLSCRCPLKKGRFSISDLPIDLPIPGDEGTYIVVANVTRGGDPVFCQEILARFKSFTLEEENDADDNGDAVDV